MSEDSGSTSSDSMELPPVAMQEMNLQANGPLSFQNGFRNSSAPSVDIVEQPQQRGFRFRYRCEGPSHGGLQGEHSERGNKTYPAIKINNHSGPAVVMVTLVTDEKNPRTHAHELMGKHCQNGICVVNVHESPGPDSVVTFPNLGILHVTKKKVESILRERIIESMKRHQHLTHSNYTSPLPDVGDELKAQATKQAKDDSKKMHLNVVRLKFQVYLPDASGNYSRLLDPVVSNTVYDSKCPGVAGLNICRMDRNAGCSTGHEEVFLLCDKVQKDDILVRFFEKDEDDQVKWEAFGNFGPSDVHRQYAIVFKTPPYQDPNIATPVQVMVQLRRISDHETSEPKPFTYFPQQLDKDEVGKKRKKALPFDTRRRTDNFFPNSQPGTGGPGGVSFCRLTGSDGTNNAGSTNSGGRVNTYNFIPDLLGCASGPRMEMQTTDAQMAAAGQIMHQAPCLQQQMQQMQQQPLAMSDPQQQMFTKLQMSDQEVQLQQVLNSQPHVIKPMEMTSTSPIPEPTLEELTSLLATCNPEVLLTQTEPLSVTTFNDQKVMIPQPQQQVQMGQQQQIYRQQQPMQQQQQQQQQFMQSQQMQQGFQQQMTGQMVRPNQAQMATGQMAQQQFSPSQQQQQQHIQQQAHYPQQTQQQQSPYSPGQAQYSPASQQAYSPGAQPAYSPGSTHSFSPGAQQQQQQFSPAPQQQYSPNSQHQISPTHQQPSPPAQPYYFDDLVIDGEDTEKGHCAPIISKTDDVVVDTEFKDSDLEEDAVPMNPEVSRLLEENFHRKYNPKPSDAEALIDDLQKLSLKKSVNEESEKPKDGEENTEKVETVETPVVQDTNQSVLDLDLHLAFNVAKRSIIALHNYSKTGDPVYLMLCQRHLISVQDDLGDTALHMAIIHRQTEVAVKLLQTISTLKNAAGEIVNSLNILRQTPLQLAVITCQPHLIPLLLAQHADPHLVDKEGNTPLHLAARLGYAECVVSLLQAEKGCPRTLHKQFEALNYEGFSALHLAIIHGHFECMRQMVERGADVNLRDGRSGRTALHHAVEADNHAMAGYILLKTDVDVDAFAYDRSTALHMAVGRRLYAMAKLLVASDANPEADSGEVVSAEYEDDIVEDSDDAVDDGDDGSEGSDSSDYMRPIDMAQGDEKMLKILNHDDIDLGFEDDSKVIVDSSEGDMGCLDQQTLQALADKLDAVSGQSVSAQPPQAGWQALANRLGLMSAMDRFRDQPSPTLHLLDTYKVEKGTLRELRKVLNDMERYDAAALVDKFITTPKPRDRDPSQKLRPEINDLSKLHLAGSDSIDLGYRSLGSFS